MHAELSRDTGSTEPLTFQGLSENPLSRRPKLGREFGSILENQEIGVRAGRLTREALNDHSDALTTPNASCRKTVAPGAPLQFMKQCEH